MNEKILFGQVLDTAIRNIKPFGTAFGKDVVLVRDLFGRVRVLLSGPKRDYNTRKLGRLEKTLSGSLGRYALPPEHMLLFTSDLLDGDRLFESPDRQLLLEESSLRLWLLDRQLIGQDWTRAPLKRETRTRRVTFFGIKGGVGRSTALAVWAWRLARQGKDVLVFDVDLESPGVGSTLLPQEFLPDYGIVDWFVEDAAGQADAVENLLVAESPLSKDLSGRIRVVPAFGRDTGDYLPKLARCYLEPTGSGATAWGERLQRMVETFERRENPDVVFLDSRAGLHDIAAVTVTRMGADAFLFAVDSTQTWTAYSFLFQHWKQHPQLTEFRRRLQVVAGMVPETAREAYLRRFMEHSWDLFREHIYDEAEADNPDAFSFDVDSEEAPHYPLPVFWNRALQEFDPCRSATGMDEQIAEAALGKFMTEAEAMVLPVHTFAALADESPG